jgi:hypothetical protein
MLPLKLHSSSALVDHGHTEEEGEIHTHKESSLLLCSFCVHGWLMMSSSVKYQLDVNLLPSTSFCFVGGTYSISHDFFLL